MMTASVWDVLVAGEQWVLDFDACRQPIGPADMPWGIAVDAACEFLDRIDSSRLPAAELMALCVKNAWRQR